MESRVELKVIKTEENYDAAINELERLIDLHPVPGSSEADQLEVLSILIGEYEEQNFSFDIPDPVSAIEFVMDQRNLKRDDLIPYLGSRARVSEILSGKRELSKNMMRKLHNELGIPAEILLQEPGAKIPAETDIQWEKFPILQMVKLCWFPKFNGTPARTKEYAEDLIAPLIDTLTKQCTEPFMMRTSVRKYRGNRVIDSYALIAWQAKVVELAAQDTLELKYSDKTVEELMQRLVNQTVFDEGPLHARQLLNQHGIHLIILPHLQKTYLDGAAMMLKDGSPVIGLTLRYDRLDNFWFSLMHELVHVSRHFNEDKSPFFDDFEDKSEGLKDYEREADKIAGDVLIPSGKWNTNMSEMINSKGNTFTVRNRARELNIHPSILVGRIHHDVGDYKRFRNLLGNGVVSRLFGITMSKSKRKE